MIAAYDPQTLRAFVAVAREGSVSRAAQALHLSQPAVSLQLKALARQTGLALFTRTAHGLAPTRDAAMLLPQAERALAALADFGQAAQNLRGAVRGTLRIGTILDPEFTRLGAFLGAFLDAAPQADTELRQAMSGDHLAALARGALDVAFYLGDANADAAGQGAAGADFAQRTLAHFTYRVLAPAGWGLQVQGRDWRALAALPWLGTPPASVHHRLQAAVFGPGSLTGLAPRRVALVEQEASMLDLVRSGVGLSLVRDSIAMHEAQTRGLVVADKVLLDCSLTLAWQRGRESELLIAAALGVLDAVWG
ncbi:LysR family transcriptional regulator [Ramlibacter sp. H39-3-26]|uniref:LysR family transcriptional regulator n=1 Tax=Curvibacter soli TaxID=3031331 RepID=UPI0023DB22FF|nr:LysR family transcriptional regulator [Ramlibacter sp. H39-3-26]MDF1486291.1 LysR family transcriptional regulator [Ramlibacter sp. H39-3-26]